MIQLDILRGIHSDLHHVSEEVVDTDSWLFIYAIIYS